MKSSLLALLLLSVPAFAQQAEATKEPGLSLIIQNQHYLSSDDEQTTVIAGFMVIESDKNAGTKLQKFLGRIKSQLETLGCKDVVLQKLEAEAKTGHFHYDANSSNCSDLKMVQIGTLTKAACLEGEPIVIPALDQHWQVQSVPGPFLCIKK